MISDKYGDQDKLRDTFVHATKKNKILVVGDAMLDCFILGNPVKLSAEAPIPVLLKSKEIVMPGGALNVVRNLKAFGVSVTYLGVFNPHHKNTSILLDTLHSMNVRVLSLFVPEWITPVKTRYHTDHQQVLRLDEEDPLQQLSHDDQQEFIRLYDGALTDVDVVIFSDYAKGLLSPTMVHRMIDLTHERAFVLVDPKPVRGYQPSWNKWKGVDNMTPNFSEYSLMLSGLASSNKEVEQLLESSNGNANHTPDMLDTKITSLFMQMMDMSHLIVTQSDQGATYFDPHHKMHVSTHQQMVYDVSGAGDTFISIIATMWPSFVDDKISSTQLIHIGNIASGLAVSKRGTATVAYDEIIQSLQKETQGKEKSYPQESKIHTLSQAQRVVQEWKKQGLKVGFANGCFDMLHLGHIYLLRQACEHVDRLIVAVNSDQSVKKLKGHHRPIFSLQCRMELLASLQYTDAVLSFSDDTPLSCMMILQPDVLFKGKDYADKLVVGEKEMLEWGGHIQLLDLMDGYSTTNIIKKIQGFSKATKNVN